jgi:hypothetical protein
MNRTVIDPSEVLATGDPGDETQRNFRYQNAYGAILLIAGATSQKPYSAIWCEHHEDLLAERIDKTYDAYQVKTKQPENGYWEVTSEEIIKSIKRFVNLYIQFGEKIHLFAIISNTDFFTCGLDVKEDRLKKSLVRMLEGIRAETEFIKFNGIFLTVLTNLALKCSCEPSLLFKVLKITHLKKGPSREDFDAEISHNHLTKFEACRMMPRTSLNVVRDEIIQQIHKAASLQVEDSKRYLVNIESKDDPVLLSKRVSIEAVEIASRLSTDLIFRYQPVDLKIDLKNNGSSTDILTKKFIKGNLAEQLQTMKRRKISSERRLLEINASSPETFGNLLVQLESYVQGECDESLLEAKLKNPDVFGPDMLFNLFTRLKDTAINRPEIVNKEQYETLVGIAGLLTENCSVWWSEKFDIN